MLFPLAIKYDFPKFIKLILFIWIVSISFFFWLISIDLSKKYFHPGKKYWAILILKLIISIWSIRPERTFFFLSPTDEIIKNFLRFLPPATFSAVLIILSLYNLYQNLNHDLVDSQKKIRQEILIISGFTAAVILILRLILHSKELEFYFFLTVHSI
ncbi:MAG: hypothetical protein KDK36_20945, partial [Leptospiraceae bacterium]|nr:hypothetical protein [Leptospiraceae bacterium]